ncbi:MAG: hypothetical protein MRZ79_05660 [Bacteroidia bacterium]|nr:hypothetical protein [Bacteroidia bacterium]
MFLFRNAFVIGLLLVMTYPLLAQTRSRGDEFHLEKLINLSLEEFPFSQENKFRLAVYAELKGVYSSQHQALNLDFSDLGSLAIYQRSCVLKTHDRRLYYLNKGRNSEAQVEAFNEKVHELLERIFLFSNHHASQLKIDFVDTYLAKKNIEPYEKIFLRHLLIRYGRYDKEYERVEFHTDWLPEQSYLHLSKESKSIVRKPINPLWIKLDKNILRGYFIRDRGTVYVEDVKRDIFFATGEEYAPNIGAFKSFLYKMLTQTTQFIINKEKKRLEEEIQVEDLYANNSSGKVTSKWGRSRGASSSKGQNSGTNKPLYQENDWIPMMLGILRSQNINIGDADIIRYFVDEPYFDELYKQLTIPERKKVNAYLDNRP